jgi:hypothetical protein
VGVVEVQWIDGRFYPVQDGIPDLSRPMVWREDTKSYVPVPAGWLSSKPA